MKLKKAFTMAEAVLTMTILGIIAATMITTLKPAKYQEQGFNVLKRKAYAELDSVMQTFMVDCCQNMNATTVYPNCVKSSTAVTFGANNGDNGLDVATVFGRYMRGTVGAAQTANSTCLAKTGYTSIKLKNGVCVYFGNNSIKVDVNGQDKPETVGSDQMVLTVGVDGIVEDVDYAIAGKTQSNAAAAW